MQDVYFVEEGTEEYNEETGNYDTAVPIKGHAYATVDDQGEERLIVLYGSLKQEAYIIAVLGDHKEVFDYIEMNNKKYKVDLKRKHHNETAYYVSEMP